MSLCPGHKRAIDPAEATTLLGMFLDQARRFGPEALLHARDGEGWTTMSWESAADSALRLGVALGALGIAPGDRVIIVSENRPEWLIAELGILAAGAIAVPAYTTNTAEDHRHILTDSGAVAAIVSTARLARPLLAAIAGTHACRHVIAMEAVNRHATPEPVVHDWSRLIAGHEPAPPPAAGRGDTAVLIYTSGTGGAPKGVMLSHGAILSNCEGAQHLFRDLPMGREVFLSFLPLSHSYEHMAGQFMPISLGAEIYYAASLESLSQDMVDARPTIMTAVPRLYEVLQGRIRASLRRAPGFQRRLFEKTLAIGRKRYEAPQSLSLAERLLDPVLDIMVRRKVRARFGGRLRFMVSGGAPLNYEVGLFFTALGLCILQGYGQTESAPVISCNPPARPRLDTVGPPFKEVELRIAEDGEICVRGELVMQGYWNNADATNEAIRDGWLHTGDIGMVDEDGYLRITDRKKDIIVNSGGDNIAPQRIEGFLTLEPEIAQAMVFGDKRPHLVALIVPDEAAALAWARARKSGPAALADLVESPQFREHIDHVIAKVNGSLSPVERVRRFLLTPEPFTVENHQMTPTLKLRRHVLKEVYGERLEGLYRRS